MGRSHRPAKTGRAVAAGAAAALVKRAPRTPRPGASATRGRGSAAAQHHAPAAATVVESAPQRRARARRIVRKLHELYPEADCALEHAGPYQLLVSTILSAQSTDETVNKVTPALFARFPAPADLAAAEAAEVERIIHSTGFFRQKTKSLIGMARKVVEDFGGQVPDTMEALVTLPGVARKTANVVLGTCFKKNEGVVVDTHVGRLAQRLALTWNGKHAKDAVKIERDLMEVLRRDEWTFVGHALIWHGRRVCHARKPRCADCALARDCPSAFTFES